MHQPLYLMIVNCDLGPVLLFDCLNRATDTLNFTGSPLQIYLSYYPPNHHTSSMADLLEFY